MLHGLSWSCLSLSVSLILSTHLLAHLMPARCLNEVMIVLIKEVKARACCGS